jgi:hypothetical protein
VEIVVVLAFPVAFALALAYPHRRGRLSALRRLWLPALLLGALLLADELVTLRGTWGAPKREADPLLHASLARAGWPGLCLELVLWILVWALFIDGLEALRLRISRLATATATVLRCARFFTICALAMGDLDGLTSWTHTPAFVYRASSGLLAVVYRYAPRAIADFPLAYVLYPALVFGAVCTVAHIGIGHFGRRVAGVVEPIRLLSMR